MYLVYAPILEMSTPVTIKLFYSFILSITHCCVLLFLS